MQVTPVILPMLLIPLLRSESATELLQYFISVSSPPIGIVVGIMSTSRPSARAAVRCTKSVSKTS